MRLLLLFSLLATPVFAQESIAPPCADPVGHHGYDPALGAWRQLWTDRSGRTVDMKGEAGTGTITYRWTIPGGGPALGRYPVSLLPGGKVRQHGERSTDGGNSWGTTFDYVYTRRAA